MCYDTVPRFVSYLFAMILAFCVMYSWPMEGDKQREVRRLDWKKKASGGYIAFQLPVCNW